jgi:hypothetical protein
MNKSKFSKLLWVFPSTALLLGSVILFPGVAQSGTTGFSLLKNKATLDLAQEQGSSQIIEEESSGGKGGKPFHETIPSSAVQVVGVNVWGGKFIDAIQFIWKNAQGERIEGEKWGGGGGTQCIQLELKDDQYIKSITGKYGRNIDKLVIERSDGSKATCGGGGGQTAFEFIAPEGKAIWGVFGRSGNFLDAIGVLYKDTPQ